MLEFIGFMVVSILGLIVGALLVSAVFGFISSVLSALRFDRAEFKRAWRKFRGG